MEKKERIQEIKQSCFIITPIGDEKSTIFRKAKGVIDSVIKPVLELNGFSDIKPAYEINVSGMITTQIINRIINDDLVIANLTGTNPNVMYELCLRHVVAKPIIHICENRTTLPFDIKDNRTIYYENDMLGVEELKTKLSEFLKETDFSVEYRDNPVYTAYKLSNILKESKNVMQSEQLELLIDISEKVTELNNMFKLTPVDKSDVVKIQILEEITHIDVEKARRLLKNIPSKMSGYDLAKTLNVKNQTIKYIIDKTGINVYWLQSNLYKRDLEKIMRFICELIIGDK